MKSLLYLASLIALFSCSAAEAAGPLVISEFMASNRSTLLDDTGQYSDWIEIHNLSSNTVNLLGWSLTDDPSKPGKWSFPATNLAGGKFLVVFASAPARAIPGAPLHTGYQLSATGEYLGLFDPNGVVASEYAPAYPPQAPDVSFGLATLSITQTVVTTNAALRVSVPANGNDGTNWMIPGFDDSTWISGTNGVGYGAANAVPAIKPFARTDLGPAMSNVNATAYVRLPFTILDPATIALVSLRIRYDDGFAAFINGRLVASVNAPADPAFDSTATAAHAPGAPEEFRFNSLALQPGQNILAIQGLNLAAGDEDFLIQAELVTTDFPVDSPAPLFFTTPSPGTDNLGGVANPGPAVQSVAHAPNVPLEDEDLVVTAHVAPTFAAVAGVVLRYRVMYGAEVELPMFDDGAHGDGLASDGVYSATIPANASTSGQMVRYYIRTTDVRGNTSRWPLFAKPFDSPEYLGTVVSPDYVSSQLPIYHMFAAPGVVQTTPPTTQSGADSETGGRVAIFYDGELYDNVYMELRGNTSATQNKKSHRLEFNREHPFRHREGFPRVRKTSFMAEFLDPAYLRQHLSFWLLEQGGIPAPFFDPVRVQLNGAFYGLEFHSDVIDLEQVERMGFDPAGALYKAVGNCAPSEFSTGVFQKKSDPIANHTDYQTLTRSIYETNTVAGRRQAAFDQLDVPEIVSYLASARFSAENDDVWANMSLYRDTLGDGLWRIIPFDMNASWGQRYGGITPLDTTNDTCKSHPLYGSSATVACDAPGAPNNFNRMYDTIVQLPELRQMMLRRERTILDRWAYEPGVAPQSRRLETHIRQMTNMIWTEAFLDRQKWGFSSWTASNRYLTNAMNELFNEFINPRRFHFDVTHCITNVAKPLGIAYASNAGIPRSQPDDANIYITSLDYNPASANQAQEYVCLTNPNPYALEISGWNLGGGVNFTFKPGTIIPSNSVLYVSPDVKAFRARTVSPRGGQGLFVVGPYQGQLSARGETLFITDDRGRGVSTNSYEGSPSPAQNYLRITEIMYNPTPLAGNTNDAQAYEYIELRNISTDTPIDLNGVKFVNGVEFAFTGSAITTLAPGQRVLVVRDLGAFTARYGSGLPVAGAYAGQLENHGERIQLLDAVNEEILDFSYNNSWYPITDGAGFSLAIVDESADPDLWGHKSNWRANGVLNGAPGAADPQLPPIPPIVINEILTHTVPPSTDAIELFNPTAGTVNLGGWFLTDDFDTPKKYRIPNTNIVAGGYLVFDESEFNTPTNAPTSFALSSAGDQVYLFSGDGTNLTGYVQGFSFGAAASGVSLGRYVDSQTNVQFVAQSAVTLGATNAAPRVGPVVISEINYHPPELLTGFDPVDNALDEYIELHNITGAPVPLYDAGHPTNRWRLRDGVSFTFPTNTTLAPGAFVLVVSFTPRSGPELEAFRAVNNVLPGTPIYGPWSGKLNNSDNHVELARPDLPDPVSGDVPFVLVDKVDYEDHAPWPTNRVDGGGLTLQRIDLAAFGNDPVNWQAATRTPGAAAPTGVATPPAIVIQPANVVASENAGATFTVGASGSPPLTYEWLFNGLRLRVADSPTLALSSLRLDQAGSYSCRVFNGVGETTSSSASLTVRILPRISQQPTNRPVIIAPDPRAARVRVVVDGVTNLVTTTNVPFSVGATTAFPPLTYQWFFNGVPIPGATDASVTVTNVQLASEGDYSCLLTDGAGTVATANARLTPWIAPVFVQPPLGQAIAAGSDYTATVEVTGHPPPFLYNWRRGSVVLATNTTPQRRVVATFNSTTAGLILAPGMPSTNFLMRLVVFNDATSVGSVAAYTNTVLADFDRDGIPDVVEDGLGLSSTSAADAALDLDGDGVSNLAEYTAGTDPADPLSFLKINSIAAGAGGATLSFNAVSNRSYAIDVTDAVGNVRIWRRLTNTLARPDNHLETVTDPSFTTNRYYRLSTPPRP